MGEVSKALALEESFDYQGKTYKLAPLTFEVIGLWEMWLKQRADRDLLLSKRWLPPADYAEHLSVLQQDKAAGRYDFFSAVSAAAQQGWEGKIELVALRLAEAPANQLDAAAARKLARDIHENDLEAWAALVAKQAEMDHDPNFPSPAKGPGSGSASSPSAPSSPASPGG